jgi:PAS domain S-box-containing protein
MKTAVRALAIFLCVSGTVPSGLRALDPTKSVFQFNCENWTRASGLPADKITGVTQTKDGYIWLGGQNGLIRFDGVDFKAVPIDLPEAHGQDVAKLRTTDDGKLWFSITNGGFGSYDGHGFAPIGDAKWTSAAANATNIFVSSDGVVWGGSVYGWARWVPGKPAKAQRDDHLSSVLLFTEDPTGRVWMGTAERGLYYWADGKFNLFPDADLKEQNVQALAVDSRGDIWVGTGRGLYHYDAKFNRREILLTNTPTNALLVDSHGILWVATYQHGLGRYQNGHFDFLTKPDGLGSDNVNSLFEDNEGSLWVGTVDGLSQLTDLKFPIYSEKEGLASGGGLTVAPSRRGGLWISTSAGASYFDGIKPVNYTQGPILPNAYVRRIFEANNGDVYFCDGEKNIIVMTAEGQPSTRYANTSWPEAFFDEGDAIVAAIGPSLFWIRDHHMEPFTFAGGEPPFDWINCVRGLKNGELLVGTNNGLFLIRGSQWLRLSTADGLTSNRILCSFEDPDGDVWLGLPTGMARLKDHRLTEITTSSGLLYGRIYSIVPDDSGYFWLASGRGVMRVPRAGLKAFVEGKSKQIACIAFDGLESIKFTDRTDQGFTGCRTADGRIWFPNAHGVTMINPTSYFTNPVPPRVHIDKIWVNGVERPVTDRNTLSGETRSLEFFFSALSYIAPKKIRIRYQLQGFDHEWIDAETHRSVSYSNLPGGHYVFRVQAANADGVWNTAGDSREIDLPRPFYHSIWFYLAGGAAGALILAGLFKLKVRRLQSANSRLETKVAQRTDELANSLSLLQATLDSSADGILAIQFSGEIASYNRQYLEMWGISPAFMESATDRKVRDFCATRMKDPIRFIARIEEIHTTREVNAMDVLELSDGRQFERVCRPQLRDGQSIGIVINFRDVTGRKRAEAKVAEASALLESLLANTLDIVFFKDRESRFVRYSHTLLPLYGETERDALKGKSDFDLFPKEIAQGFFDEEQEIIRSGEPVIDKLERGTSAKGEPSWIMTTKTPWRDIHGNIIGTFSVARDVTVLKEFESKLAYERDLLRALLESSPDKIYFKDRESRFIICSNAQVSDFKVHKIEQVVGKTDFDFFSEEHARAAYEDEQEIIRTGQPLIGKIEKETWRDGRITWVLTSKIPLRSTTGEVIGTIGISKDISELKRAESNLAEAHKQLVQTSRQAGMAEVATSVLHNVGNVLNSVNVSATLVMEQMRDSKVAFVGKTAELLEKNVADLAAFISDDPKGQKIVPYLVSLGRELASEQQQVVAELGHLRKNIEHIKEVVAMQQSFARVSGVVEKLNLPEIIDDALRINSTSLVRHEVELIRDYQSSPEVITERHKVMQILVNLIRNAKYACDEAARPDKRIIVRLTQTGDRVVVAVIDNGVGIPPENLTRIFAHGFTTKKEGHGFGLHSGALTAKELGGTLIALSDGPGTGATFILELPLTPANGVDASP